MPVDDPSDLNVNDRELRKRVERLEAGTGGGDSSHKGAADHSVALGEAAEATGDYGTAVGWNAHAEGDDSVALGSDAWGTGNYSVGIGLGAQADGDYSTALGASSWAVHFRSSAIGWDSTTTADNQIMLGRNTTTVYVPGNLTVAGTFSNPSARRLKQDIVPAPDLPGVFPELVEYAYIEGDGQRRLGYIADDLVGTDAERFVQADADGNPEAIDYLGLLVAQNAQLQARLTVLENLIEGLTNG
jgi:hypothetical protein